MKLDQLRKIIREEVRAAVKSELQEVMNEAVKIASTPTVQKVTENNLQKVETPNIAPPIANGKKASITEMLQMTKSNMSNDDYKTVFNGNSSMVQGMPNMASSMANQMSMNAGNQPGLDLSNLDFVKRAGEVFKKSETISANKIQ